LLKEVSRDNICAAVIMLQDVFIIRVLETITGSSLRLALVCIAAACEGKYEVARGGLVSDDCIISLHAN